MPDNLTDVAENGLLTHALGGAFTVTAPIMARLMTANGSDTTAGTQVAGGSYAPQQVTFGAAAGGQASNSAVVTFANMPAGDVVGVELWDSSATPQRLFWGPLSTTRTLTAGDGFEFAVGALVVSLT